MRGIKQFTESTVADYFPVATRHTLFYSSVPFRTRCGSYHILKRTQRHHLNHVLKNTQTYRQISYKLVFLKVLDEIRRMKERCSTCGTFKKDFKSSRSHGRLLSSTRTSVFSYSSCGDFTHHHHHHRYRTIYDFNSRHCFVSFYLLYFISSLYFFSFLNHFSASSYSSSSSSFTFYISLFFFKVFCSYQPLLQPGFFSPVTQPRVRIRAERNG